MFCPSLDGMESNFRWQNFIFCFAVTQILFVFIKTFNKSRDDNEKQADLEKKKLEKEAMKERAAGPLSAKKEGIDVDRLKHDSHHERHNTIKFEG